MSFSPLANILFPWQEEQRELAQCWKTENQFSVTEVTKNSLKNPRNLRTGSGFARTNLALVLWTRSRGDAHGGEIDISDFFALNVVSNFSFKLQKYFLSSPTSHLPGVQRPTDCLWSGSEAWARFKLSSTPSADCSGTQRPWQVKAEKQEFSVKDKHCFQRWKQRLQIWTWFDKRSVVVCLSLVTEASRVEADPRKSRSLPRKSQVGGHSLCQGQTRLWTASEPKSKVTQFNQIN